MQIVYLGGDPRKPGEMVPPGIRSLVPSVVPREKRGAGLYSGVTPFSVSCCISLPMTGSKESQWGKKCVWAWPARAFATGRGVPVMDNPAGPGSAETAPQGTDSSVEPGTPPKGVIPGVSKFPFSLLTQREDELRPEQPLGS